MNLAADIRAAYHTLDLMPGATWEDVRRAYRRLARALHPDLNPGRSGEDMARVNRAYQRLSEFLASQPQPPAADGYRSYDFPSWMPRQGQRPYAYQPFKAQPPQPAPAQAARPAAPASQPSPFVSPVRRPAPAPGPAPMAPLTPVAAPRPSAVRPPRESWQLVGLRRDGRDLVYQVRVSGHPLSLLLPVRNRRACPHCGGSGHQPDGQGRCATCAGRGYLTSSQLVPVELPRNWQPGQLLRLSGQGQDGDILVELLPIGREA